jgi:hypothetical protein
LDSGAPALIPIEGEPAAQLVVDPPDHIRLRLVPDGAVPVLDHYRALSAEIILDSATRWLQLSVSGRDVLLEAYPLICRIADQVQLNGVSVRHAVMDVLVTYQHLLARSARLSEKKEIGLLGELVVLNHLLDGTDEALALASWRGPYSEEHDFGLSNSDVEVKSTLGEERRHWVGAIHQLEPTGGRPLWLLSLQLTRSGTGGRSLPQQIALIRNRLSSTVSKHEFDERMEKAGWLDDQAALYRDSYRLRSDPMAFEILPGFPAITGQSLSTLNLPPERILKLAYLVDLTGLTPGAEPPTELSGFSSKELT